ncbi:MAG: HTTM domain-containing protein [Planctomycetota bacterium]|nr:MAG: HTTM domain-containing protein [Planctomycetota bacterium]
MKGAWSNISGYFSELWAAWNRFWFTPVDPATLSLVRLLGGGMLLYTHLVWSLDLSGFIGPDGYTPLAFMDQLQREWSVWSVFAWTGSMWGVWTIHIVALVAFAMLFMGLFSRTSAVVAYLLAVSYAHRVTPGAYFGLDKANCMIALYLVLGPCGARYSLDRLWRLRRGDQAPAPPSVSANIAVRLLQLHLCVVYLFSGLAKLEGVTWKLGTAMWWAAANYEYQSLDLTWLAGWPMLVALITHLTLFWELFYCCLVWNRFTRPIVLWTAVVVHGGIALFMGMITFGLAMIIANLSFLRPETVRRWVDPVANRVALALVGRRVG